MMKRLKQIALLLVFLSACIGNNPETTTPPATEAATLPPPTETLAPSPLPPTETNPPATETPSPVAYGPDNFPANVDPLTAMEVSNPTLLERRPIAIKVQIFPRGQRPPWGVSMADLVFDYYQNYGLTRFHSIFYSNDVEVVGPIRSARLLDIDLVSMYRTIFVFGSAEQRTYSRLFSNEFANRLVVEGYANCPPMCRVDPNGYNYLVTNTSELSKYVTQKGVDNVRQNLNGMSFNETLPPGGQPGQQVFIRYSISAYLYWNYDPSSGRYLRFQDTQEAPDQQSEGYIALTDRLTGQQIAADNVVVLIAPHKFAFNTHPGPSEVIDILLSGSGPAYAYRDGQLFQTTWNRPAKDKILFLSLPDGTPYPYKPGNTWYQIVGQSSKIQNDVTGIWRFQFWIP
jgi:hypothetical protein